MALLLQNDDPSTQQTAAGFPDLHTMRSTYLFTAAETENLRALATRVAEIAALPIQGILRNKWLAHNDLKSNEPLVFIDPENGWNECIPAETLLCTDPLARVWEMYLRKQIYWFDVMKDDKVIEAVFDVPYAYTDTGWGVTLMKEGGEHGGAYIVKQAIENYEEDFHKLHYPRIIINWEESARVMELAETVFCGILKVRRKATWYWTLGMTWEYINLRGLEDFMCDMIEEPEWVHRMMHLLCEGTLAKLEYLETEGLLATNCGNTYVASGGFGFTDDLPLKDGPVTTMDNWGFVESQETTAVSPDMYGNFIFPYHRRIAERFGLNCYGCCEPFNPRWKYVKQLPRLRKVSCSPWSDWSLIPQLLGKNYIASVKPSPTPLAMPMLDEDAVRKDIGRALEIANDSVVEIIMKDNNTLGKNPHNASRWVEIVREEMNK